MPITLLDMEALRCNILTGLTMDTDAQARLNTLCQTLCPDSKWSLSPTGFLLHEGVVYVPTGGDLQMCILKACHDHLLTGHPGQMKTLELLRHDYFWPKMREDVITFVKSCITCGCAKARRHQPYGTLQQLPIPERLWHSISMDFIEQLPPSSNYSVILVIVNRLTKQHSVDGVLFHACSLHGLWLIHDNYPSSIPLFYIMRDTLRNLT